VIDCSLARPGEDQMIVLFVALAVASVLVGALALLLVRNL
jgi:hypothetical protein